jgi:hypothetical protein
VHHSSVYDGVDAEQAAEFLRRSLVELSGSVDAARAKHGVNAVQWRYDELALG